MNLFKSTVLTWWQLGTLKIAVLFIGVAIGAAWPTIFVPYAALLAIVGILLSLYVGFVWFKQR